MENPRIQSLHIKNYRLFKDFKMEGLGWVNLVSGKNNSGKTVLLEAIRILENEGNIVIVNDVLNSRQEYSEKYLERYKNLSFGRQLGMKQSKVAIEFELNFLDEESKKHDLISTYYFNAFGVPKEFMVKKGRGSFNDYPTWKLEDINTLIKDSNVVDKASFVGSSIEFNNKFLWKDIELTDEGLLVEDALRLIDSNVEKLQIYLENEEYIARVALKDDLGRRKVRNLKSLGDGMNRILTIALAAATSTNKVLLIDEFETGLHYSIQAKLWDFIFKLSKKFNIQVFATTHSRDCIEAFQEVSSREEFKDRNGKFFRLEKKEDEIKAVPFSAEQLDFATSEDLEIR